jgi:outer membrane protein OmpA-like peptidoglycan-associated protein
MFFQSKPSEPVKPCGQSPAKSGLFSRPRVFCLCAALFVSATLLSAQTAAEMDILLETEAVSFGQAARFVLITTDWIDPASSAGAAYALAREKGWAPEKSLEHNPIKTGELCFLIMKAFDMKGSFLYSLFPGPRYAFRELDYLGLLPGRRDPGLRVSGEGLLRILDMTSSHTGKGAAAPPAADTPAAELPPAVPAAQYVPPAAVPALSREERREEMAGRIRTELDQYKVADTTVRVGAEGIVISLNNIQFMPDSAALTTTEEQKLRDIAGILSQYPDRKILVGGHTALAGTEEMRLQISRDRARVVADFLVSIGVRRASEIVVKGYGASQPLGNNATAEGQAMNRRVEIILMDE